MRYLYFEDNVHDSLRRVLRIVGQLIGLPLCDGTDVVAKLVPSGKGQLGSHMLRANAFSRQTTPESRGLCHPLLSRVGCALHS